MRIDQKLLSILIDNQDSPLSAKKLAFMLGISEKTAMKYMTMLKDELQNHGALIVTKQRVGSSLVIMDTALFRKYCRQLENKCVMDDPNLRKKYVLTRLMLTDTYISIYDLAEEISVSPSLLRMTIRELDSLLNGYRLKLDHSHFHGYRITGEEQNIRRCLTNECKESDYIKETFVDSNFASIDQSLIRQVIADSLEHFNISVSNESIRSLMLHILVAINRIETSNPVLLENDQVVLSIKTRIEYQVASRICNQIESHSNFRFPDNEVIYLTMHISGQQRLYSHEHITVNANEKALLFYNRFLRNILRYTNEDFFNDEELRSSLLNHIVPFLNRFENNMQIEKSELNNIKDEFPYAYDLAVAGLALPELSKYHLTEAENSYFALHLQLSMEKRKENDEIKYNVLIYSKETSSIYYMMSYKFNYYFADKIREIVFASFDDAGQYDENDFDLVFKTSETFEDPYKRAVAISPYMNQEDVETVRMAFKKLQSVILDTIMIREYLFFDLDTRTREETIQEMIEKTKAYIPITDDFYDAVMEREIKASTEFEGRIAIPHPMSALNFPEFITVARLNKPIIWKRKPVQLVFLMCSSRAFNPIIYQKLKRMIKDPELSQSLMQAKNFQEFVYLFEKI